MPVDFSADRWAIVKENYRKWWAHELRRPLIQLTFVGYEPVRPKPDIPFHHFASFYGLSVPVEKVVDWWEYNLETVRFSTDAFPHVIPYFGPGVAAAFMGAELVNGIGAGTTWFHPPGDKAPAELSLRHDPNGPWWPRVCDCYRAARDRFGGQVQIDMTDLGGNLDLLSTFRPSERLLLDLYDAPDEVKRLTWEGHDRWWDYFDRLAALCGYDNPGYTAWCPIFSEKPYYMLQCDFCYMIGPRMFDEFVKPELSASCRRLVNPFYHLDGPGQLPHLDSLLEIEELKGIQWIPGDGSPDITQWPDVYRRIHKAGKLIQFYSSQSKRGLESLDVIAEQIGTAEGLIMIGDVNRKDEEKARRFLEKYGAD